MERLNNTSGPSTVNDDSVDAGAAQKVDPNTLVAPDVGKINFIHILIVIILILVIVYLFKKDFLTQTILYVSN